jgi:hypothetical protein
MFLGFYGFRDVWTALGGRKNAKNLKIAWTAGSSCGQETGRMLLRPVIQINFLEIYVSRET